MKKNSESEKKSIILFSCIIGILVILIICVVLGMVRKDNAPQGSDSQTQSSVSGQWEAGAGEDSIESSKPETESSQSGSSQTEKSPNV